MLFKKHFQQLKNEVVAYDKDLDFNLASIVLFAESKYKSI